MHGLESIGAVFCYNQPDCKHDALFPFWYLSLLSSLADMHVMLLRQITMFVITTIFGVIRGALSKGNDRRDNDQDWD